MYLLAMKASLISSFVLSVIGVAAVANPLLPITGYYTYLLGRAEDNKVLYKSIVFLEPEGEKISIYRAIGKDPLGRYTRCGGLGCDLEKQDLIGTVNITNSSSGLRVVAATGASKFLLNSTCSAKEDRFATSLFCRSKTLPNGQAMNTVVAFIPGS